MFDEIFNAMHEATIFTENKILKLTEQNQDIMISSESSMTFEQYMRDFD